jgi:hypothetical protein
MGRMAAGTDQPVIVRFNTLHSIHKDKVNGTPSGVKESPAAILDKKK